MAAICTAGLVLGWAFAMYASRPAPLTLLRDAPGGLNNARWLRGAVAREPAGDADGSRALVDIDSVLLEGRWRSLPGRVEIRVPAPAPRPNWYRGTRVELFVRLQADRPLANPHTPRRDRLRARGIDLRGALKDWTQVRLRSPPRAGLGTTAGRIRDAVRRAIEKHHAESGLVRALLLGERVSLSDTFWQDLDRSGLLHLLAISGLHVGLLVGAAQLGCRALGLSPILATTSGLLVVTALLVLVEPRAPVQRAAIMAAAFLAARLISARVAPADSLAAAVVVLVTLAPLDVGELGLRLSTLATIGLLVGSHAGARWGAPVGILSAALLAQIAVAPLLALERWRVLPLGALWNLPAVPILTAALPSAVVSTTSEVMANTAPSGAPSDALRCFASWMASATDQLLGLFRVLCSAGARLSPSLAMPAITWPLAWGYWWGLGAAALNRRRTIKVLGLLLATGCGWAATRSPEQTSTTMVSFDVGQGDAILLHTSRDSVLYDAGGYPGLDYDLGYHVLAPQLRRRGIAQLGALAVSHAHADHAGGAAAVLREIGATALWLGSSPATSPLVRDLLGAARETTTTSLAPHHGPLPVAGCQWGVLSPATATLLRGSTSVENGASLAFDVHCSRRRIVLAGDADAAAERDWIVNGLSPGNGPVVLKVGHHGSDTSTSVALLDHLRPRHALISVGSSNPWGLPRDSVVTELYARAISVYRTDRDGAVTITLGRRLRVRGERWVRGPR